MSPIEAIVAFLPRSIPSDKHVDGSFMFGKWSARFSPHLILRPREGCQRKSLNRSIESAFGDCARRCLSDNVIAQEYHECPRSSGWVQARNRVGVRR